MALDGFAQLARSSICLSGPPFTIIMTIKPIASINTLREYQYLIVYY